MNERSFVDKKKESRLKQNQWTKEKSKLKMVRIEKHEENFEKTHNVTAANFAILRRKWADINIEIESHTMREELKKAL